MIYLKRGENKNVNEEYDFEGKDYCKKKNFQRCNRTLQHRHKHFYITVRNQNMYSRTIKFPYQTRTITGLQKYRGRTISD